MGFSQSYIATFSEDAVAPYMLDNTSALSINYWQRGCPTVDRLPPLSKHPYTWDYVPHGNQPSDEDALTPVLCLSVDLGGREGHVGGGEIPLVPDYL